MAAAKLAVHPVADLFPMLAADELAELAADIGERGLLHPIVLDTEGRVLDGRNRLAACEQAGVEPVFVEYEGDDPDGYALAVNIARRHLTKGQQAMIAAKAWSVSDQSQRSMADHAGVTKTRLTTAAVVLDHAPDMVDAVIAGATGLDTAYQVARERKTAADSVEAQLARLREEDSELADRVVEGDLSLPGAWAEQKARAAQRESERRAATANLRSVLTYLVSSSVDPDVLARNDYASVLDQFDFRDLKYAADVLVTLTTIMEAST